jgi:hypothetical protein
MRFITIITQFQNTIATNSRALTHRMSVSYAISHERTSSLSSVCSAYCAIIDSILMLVCDVWCAV